jgi:hypothetical protein
MKYAPIALFIYKRPEHTRRTLESLMQCPEFADSPLYVFCDGAKNEKDEDKVIQTRNLVRSMLGEQTEIIESSKNKGLAKSIISGVTYLCEKYSRVIVVEDDLIVSPEFLRFLNAALNKYEYETSVMQVSGYMFPVKAFANRNEAMFLPFSSSWGWATWKRAWDYFNLDASGWEVLRTNKQIQNRFNLDGSYDYFQMLQMQMAGKIDSWAIRWYWSIFNKNGYVLFPAQSYVSNIGFDLTGTHKNIVGRWLLQIETYLPSSSNFSLPIDIDVKEDEYHLVKKTIKSMNNKKLNIAIKFKEDIFNLIKYLMNKTSSMLRLKR